MIIYYFQDQDFPGPRAVSTTMWAAPGITAAMGSWIWDVRNGLMPDWGESGHSDFAYNSTEYLRTVHYKNNRRAGR